MVSIDVGVADGLDFQVDQGVFREEDQHVIEEADTGVDVVLTGAVEVQSQRDLSFCSFSVELASAMGLHRRKRAE